MSAYFDGELSPQWEGMMAEHIKTCEACAEELAGFNGLSTLTDDLPVPEPPARLWSDIERTLNSEASVQRAERVQRPDRRVAVLLVVAATVLFAIGVTWIVHQKKLDHDELAVNMAHYVEQFRESPIKAQQYLLAQYDNQLADLIQATQQLGYRPAVADGLPERYTVDAMFVMDMPCCKCVQCLCKRDDGTHVAIFEHDEDQPMWFGDRPAIDARCGNEECRVVQMNGQLAVSWKRGSRHVTVVGANSLEEVQKFVDAMGKNGVATSPGSL